MHRHASFIPFCKFMTKIGKDPVQLLNLALQHRQHCVVWCVSLNHVYAHLHDVWHIRNTGGAWTAMQAACMRSSAHMAEDSRAAEPAPNNASDRQITPGLHRRHQPWQVAQRAVPCTEHRLRAWEAPRSCPCARGAPLDS